MMDPIKKQRLAEIMEQADRLPPLPAIAKKALRLMSTPSFGMRELAEVLAMDQAIASTLLRWVNSAYFGLFNPVSSVHQAVTYLGENTVRSLVMTAALASYMDRPVQGYGLDRGELWKHAVSVALVARTLSKRFGPAVAEEAYSGGLLCDLGKLAFDMSLRNRNLQALAVENKSFADLESEFFGITHADLGAELAKRWGFPEPLQHAIAYHHEPMKANPGNVLPAAVHVADVLVTMLGIGIGRDGLQYRLEPASFERLGLSTTPLDMLLDQAATIIQENVEKGDLFG